MQLNFVVSFKTLEHEKKKNLKIKKKKEKKKRNPMSSLSFLKFQHNVLSRSSPKQSRISTTKDHQIRQKPNVTSKVFHPKAEELRSFFNKFDATKDGKISEEEYKLALRVTGRKNKYHSKRVRDRQGR